MKINMHWRAAVGGTLLAGLVPLSGVVVAANATEPVPADPSNVHTFTVVKLSDQAYGPTDQQILDRLGQAIDYWNAETGDRATLQKPTAITAYDLAADCSDGDGQLKEIAAKYKDSGKDFRYYTGGSHLIALFPRSCYDGSTSGMNGRSVRSGGWIKVGVKPDDAVELASALAHEIGHNLGLGHAGGVPCPDSTSSACEFDGYFNRYSLMGVTTAGPRPLSSFERERTGLWTSDDLAVLSLDPGRRTRSFDVDLLGVGATGRGIRGLKVTDPVTGTAYYLDFHTGLGREAGTLVADSTYTGSSGRYFNKGVSVVAAGLDDDEKPISILQPIRYDTSNPRNKVWRFGMVAGDSYTSADGGFEVRVTGMDLTGTARLHVTLTNPDVALGDQTGTIAITEKAAVGSTVTATTAGWEDAELGEIEWFDNGVAIDGATGPSFTIPATLDGHGITARVTGTRESFRDLSASSNTLVVGQDLVADGAAYGISSADRLLTTPGAATRSGTQVVLEAGDGTAANQRWTVLTNTDGSFRLKNVATRRCLDNSRSSTAPGSLTIEYSCSGNANQSWRLVGQGSGYALVNVGSGLPIAADAAGAITQQTTGTAFGFRQID